MKEEIETEFLLLKKENETKYSIYYKENMKKRKGRVYMCGYFECGEREEKRRELES